METILTSPITDKCAWKGENIADKDDWIIRLDQHLISVLDNALKTIQAKNLPQQSESLLACCVIQDF